ncbi:MAG: SH3 domain-containing protein [Chloroflexota bacterium]|nr:MAG: hypothetical protein DIU68_05540 [Chloroflexota bacterium]
MPDRPYRPDADPADLDSTQRNPMPTRPMSIPPPPPTGERGHVRVATDRELRREQRQADAFRASETLSPAEQRRARRRVQQRKDSGLFLPAWSVALMLVIVVALAGAIVFLVISLGGNAGVGGEPRIVIITAVPSETPVVSAQQDDALPALPAVQVQPDALPTFVLEGPLLPTTALTPTPTSITVGATVEVINVGLSRLNVRENAGTSSRILFQANVGDRFVVIGGPQTTNESGSTLTWWNLRGVNDPTQTGWAVENDGQQDVLRVIAP